MLAEDKQLTYCILLLYIHRIFLHLIFCHNFGKCRPILIFSLIDSQRNYVAITGSSPNVKASHTRYRALGLELILVYRQSAHYKSSAWW